MVHFVGAGPGAEDLITLRGARLLEEADVVIYAGSLVNPALLSRCKKGCELHNSAHMTLEEVLAVIGIAQSKRLDVVRLHTGDPSIYGAIREQMDALAEAGIPYEVVPGVSSFCAAAATLGMEYTLPEVSQTVIITRMAGRTPVPQGEEMASLAAHGSTMVVFLSTGLLEPLREQLLQGGYQADTPAAIVYKASWPEEKVVLGTVDTLAQMVQANGIERTALVLVGNFLSDQYERSKLYDPNFTHNYRRGTEQ